MNINHETLQQCFSTFFDSRHPFLDIEQFGCTPSYNLLVNRRKVHKFAALKGSAAPGLRTTALQPSLLTEEIIKMPPSDHRHNVIKIVMMRMRRMRRKNNRYQNKACEDNDDSLKLISLFKNPSSSCSSSTHKDKTRTKKCWIATIQLSKSNS